MHVTTLRAGVERHREEQGERNDERRTAHARGSGGDEAKRGGSRHDGRRVRAPRRRRIRWRGLAHVNVGLRLALGLLALAACDRERATAGFTERGGAAHYAYDSDSAARGLLPPDLAALLAVEPLLDGTASDGGARRCRQDTLPQLAHVRLRFDVRRGDTATTIFARRTPQGELRRAEVLRRAPDGTALGASWDASERATTVSEFGGGTVRKTTSRDDDAPLAHALRYVGRRAMGTGCGTR
jgi:hypothetical protein